MAERPVKLLHAFSTFALGGPQARFLRLVEALGPDFRHVVVAMDNCFDAAASLPDASRLELLPLPTRRGRDLDNVPLLWRTLGTVKPDRLVSYNWGAFEWTFANVLRRVPQLHVEEGFGPQETERRLPRRSAARALGLRLAPVRLVTVSDTMAEVARREWKVPASRLAHVPNGVDVAGYARRAERDGPSRFAPGGGCVVGTAAALRPEKRLDRLIDAFAIARRDHPEAVLVIAGDGPERAALEARAHEAGVAEAVSFAGFSRDLRAFYADLDAFALSSDTEQMPMAVLEAMAAGLPVASTDVGDVARMVSTDNRAQVVPKSAEALAGALSVLMADANARARLGEANLARVAERYDAARMNAAWHGLYAHGRLPG